MSGVSVVIAAYNEQGRVGDTVRAASALEGVEQVIVVDDGSQDRTAQVAREAGAQVIQLPRNLGKGGAIKQGLAQARGEIILLLDADLGETASEAAKLLDPVVGGQADLTIARFPPVPDRRGLGIATITGLLGIRFLAGLRTESPLCGQRAIRRELLDRIAIPRGFGVEVGMTIQAAWLGARIQEIPVQMSHARSGRDWAGRLHRARQFRDITLTLARLAANRMASHWLTGLILLAALMAGSGWAHSATGATDIRLTIAVSGLAIGSSLILLSLFLAGERFWPVRKPNYQGKIVPSGLGWVFVLAPLGFYLMVPDIGPWRSWIPALALVIALAGWFDDRYGSQEERGFQGHFRQLFQGKVTTGIVKIILVGLASLGMGALVAMPVADSWLDLAGRAVVNGLLIALCANAMNLLDLRPGRALKVFFLAGAVIIPAAPLEAYQAPVLLFIVMAAALVYAPVDLSGRGMMGDTGSNFLGAMLGLSIALVASFPVKLVIIALLIAFHLYCEKYSLTQAIERNPALRWLDRLGRTA